MLKVSVSVFVRCWIGRARGPSSRNCEAFITTWVGGFTTSWFFDLAGWLSFLLSESRLSMAELALEAPVSHFYYAIPDSVALSFGVFKESRWRH